MGSVWGSAWRPSAAGLRYKHSKFGADMSIYPQCNAWRHLFAYRGLSYRHRKFGVEHPVLFLTFFSLLSLKRTLTYIRIRERAYNFQEALGFWDIPEDSIENQIEGFRLQRLTAGTSRNLTGLKDRV